MLFADDLHARRVESHRLFRWLLLAQWAFVVVIALAISPWSLASAEHSVQVPVWSAVVGGGALCFTPLVLLAILRSHADLRRIAERESALTEVNAMVERQVTDRTVELAASREQYRAIVESTQAVAWEFLPEPGYSRYVAPQIETLVGYPPSRFEAPGFYLTIIHPDDRQRLAAALERGLADGLDFQEELRLVASDGRIVHVRSIVAVVRTGKTTVFRGVTFDITRQKLLEAELREAQKAESLGRMAAGVAHGVNTPLQYISNNVEFLGLASMKLLAVLKIIGSLGDAPRSGAASERIIDMVRAAKVGVLDNRVPAAIAATHDGLRAVERIVGTLKEITGMQRPRASIPTDLAECLKTSVDLARSSCPSVGISLQLDASVEAVQGDPAALVDAFSGLVRNASEACLDGARVDARVSVEATRRGHLLEVRIRDGGRGIPEMIRHRIFDPFFSTKGVGHGSGEGLHRIRDIIVAGHGGELTCEASSSAGTTFLVRLAASATTTRAA